MIRKSPTVTLPIIDSKLPVEFEALVKELDECLRPIANTPVDITQPGWGRRLQQLAHPLDRAGIRQKTETLLSEIIAAYEKGNGESRQALRGLFAQYTAFAWAATVPLEPTTAQSFRQLLLLFSLNDQGRDSRDALLLLQDLCRGARAAGLKTESILRGVAELSSDINRFGMGSTKQMLLKAC